MRRLFFVWAIIALFALGAACKKTESAPEPGGGRGGRGGGAKGNLSFAVDVMPVESKKVDYVVSAPGTIEAFERVQVTARVSGAVDRVAFTDGAQVKKGDILVVIDSERYRVSVTSAKALLDKAEASQRDMEAMVKRREGASENHPGLIPGEELETYRTRALTAKADKLVAAETLHTAELNLRDSFVRAPIDGIIQTRTVETGQFVQAGYLMATLIRSEPLLLRFQVEPQEAPRIKPGAIATFTMRESSRTFTAKITLVAAAADATTHMVGVAGEIAVDEGHKYWLRPGAFCDVSLDLGAQRESAIIPRAAARATDHGYVAYVVEDGFAKERVLALGMSTKDGFIEVRTGLKAGDLLVVRGAEALTEGAKVIPTRVTGLGADAGVIEDDAGSEDGGRKRRGGGGPRGSGSGRPQGSAAEATP